jgi:hypothetical protein
MDIPRTPLPHSQIVHRRALSANLLKLWLVLLRDHRQLVVLFDAHAFLKVGEEPAAVCFVLEFLIETARSGFD